MTELYAVPDPLRAAPDVAEFPAHAAFVLLAAYDHQRAAELLETAIALRLCDPMDAA